MKRTKTKIEAAKQFHGVQKIKALAKKKPRQLGGVVVPTTAEPSRHDVNALVEIPLVIDEEHKDLFAKFAEAAYKEPEQRTAVSTNYIYLPEMSDLKTAVWRDDKNKRFIVAFRGTVPTDWRDMTADFAVYMGVSQFLNRTKHGIELIRKMKHMIREHYHGYGIIITGHSLGGKIGLNVAGKSDVVAYLYNIGSSPRDKITDILIKGVCASLPKTANILQVKACPVWKKIVHFHVNGDLISTSAARMVPWHVVTQPMKKGIIPHLMTNFL
jgi:hypothetical protein